MLGRKKGEKGMKEKEKKPGNGEPTPSEIEAQVDCMVRVIKFKNGGVVYAVETPGREINRMTYDEVLGLLLYAAEDVKLSINGVLMERMARAAARAAAMGPKILIPQGAAPPLPKGIESDKR